MHTNDPTDEHGLQPAVNRPGAFLRLYRFSIAFTPLADVAAGFAAGALHLEEGPLFWTPRPLLAAAASMAVFCSATALNDLLDRKKDERLCPERPIPSGAISPRVAGIASLAAGLAALLLAWCAGGRTLAAVGAVLVLTVLYNVVTRKNDLLGVLNLGCIRAADLLVGWTVLELPLSTLWAGGEGALPVGIFLLLYGGYAATLSFIALGERSQKEVKLLWPVLIAAALGLVPLLLAGAGAPLTPSLVLWSVLVLPMAGFLRKPHPPVEKLVGHMAAGYFLISALIVLAADRPVLGAVLWIAYFVSRYLGRKFPPA